MFFLVWSERKESRLTVKLEAGFTFLLGKGTVTWAYFGLAKASHVAKPEVVVVGNILLSLRELLEREFKRRRNEYFEEIIQSATVTTVIPR